MAAGEGAGPRRQQNRESGRRPRGFDWAKMVLWPAGEDGPVWDQLGPGERGKGAGLLQRASCWATGGSKAKQA
jgi:hypothetical protein